MKYSEIQKHLDDGAGVEVELVSGARHRYMPGQQIMVEDNGDAIVAVGNHHIAVRAIRGLFESATYRDIERGLIPVDAALYLRRGAGGDMPTGETVRLTVGSHPVTDSERRIERATLGRHSLYDGAQRIEVDYDPVTRQGYAVMI